MEHGLAVSPQHPVCTLAQAACRQHPEREGCFELSIGNADKGLLPLEEIQRRVAQFIQAGLPLVVTQVSRRWSWRRLAAARAVTQVSRC